MDTKPEDQVDHGAPDAMPPAPLGGAPPTVESVAVEPADVAPQPDAPRAADVASPPDQAQAASASPGGSRARWLIGGGIALAAVAGLVLAVTLLGARPLPEVFRYVPADSAVVVELRPELPGDQRQHLGNFLAHFPGFEDQSILDVKIDEALDRMIGQSSGGTVDYPTQVKPLLAGPMTVSMTTAGLRDVMSGDASGGFLLVASTDGKATCDSVFGSTTVGETHRAVEIRSIGGALFISCAVHDRYMLLGNAEAIRDGVDARLDGKGIDGNSTFQTARNSLAGDQLATIFASGAALQDLLSETAAQLGQALPETAIAPWTIAGLRVIDDALVFDAYAPPLAAPSLPPGAPSLTPAAESRFAGTLPEDTLGFVEVHGVGALLQRGIAQMRADPAQADAIAQLEQGLLMLGGTDNLIGWIDDLGIAVLPTGDAVGGAVLIRGTDADTVAARLTQVRNLLVLASTGTDMTVRDTEHDGVTITTVDLGDLPTLLGDLGVPGDFGSARLQFSMAAQDDLLLVGIGEGVIERILDVESASSLQASASYRRAIEVAGPRNDLQVYVAIDAIIGVVESFASAEDLATWNRDIKPYLEHFAAGAWSSTNVVTTSRARIVLTVK